MISYPSAHFVWISGKKVNILLYVCLCVWEICVIIIKNVVCDEENGT